MRVASTSARRRTLIVIGGWCLLVFILYLISRANPSLDNSGSSSGSGSMLAVLILSVGTFVHQWRGLKKQLRTEELLAKAERDIEQDRERYSESLKRLSGHSPVLATTLGGSESWLKAGTLTLLSCRKDCIAFSDPTTKSERVLKFTDIANINITGPGTEHTNAGMVGGGFGIEGALKGIMVASVINSLTAKSTTNTFLRVSTRTSEMHFHMSTVDPSSLRMILSPAIVHIEARSQTIASPNPNTVSGEIERLHKLLQDGILTSEEFLAAKAKLLKHS